jgi:ribosome-associated translation inhibitor RaiA
MTTQLAFTFGMLAVVSIAMVIGIIVSLLKVYKLKSEVKDTISHIDKITENIDRRFDDIIRELTQKIDEDSKTAHARMDSIYNCINDTEKEIHMRIDSTHIQLDTKVDELYRHIDSRFDKFENKISTTKEKQLLKS